MPSRLFALMLFANPQPAKEHPMSTRNPLPYRAAAVVAGLALMAIPAAANAKDPPRFKLSFKGSQVITWSQGHIAQSACDATVTGDGSQSVSYKAFDPSRLELIRPKGQPALLASIGDELAPYGLSNEMTARADVEREGYQNIQAPGGACNGTGGGGIGPGPDCGPRSGLLWFRLTWAPDLLAPEGGENVTGRFKLGGRYQGFTHPLTGVEDLPIGHTYDNCPYWATTPSAAGGDELLIASEKLSVGKLAKLKKGRSLKVVADAEESYADGDFTGKTLNTWTLKLKRIN
jgi:hypothetical protein